MTDYRMSHRAPDHDTGVPLWALDRHTSDVYDHPEYHHGGDDIPLLRNIRAARSEPNRDVVIYRSIPGNADPVFKPGDWVTLSHDYAMQHGELEPESNPVVVHSLVPARHVWWNGDSLYEFGYDPTTTESE